MRPFLIALIGGWLLASATPLHAQKDPQRSFPLGGKRCFVKLTNATSTPLQLTWADFNGKMVSYGLIKAGQTINLDTFPGHLWFFTRGMEAVGWHRATGRKGESCVIKPAAAKAPGPGSSPGITSPLSPIPGTPTPATPAPKPGPPLIPSSPFTPYTPKSPTKSP